MSRKTLKILLKKYKRSMKDLELSMIYH